MSDEQKDLKQEEKMLSQSQVDAIVQERLAREKAKFADYDELKKFRSEYEKSQDAQQLKILEEQKKYEEAKKTYEGKLSEYQGILSKKDTEIQDMRVSGSLMTEITKQNAYAEETMALMKSQAVFDKEGNIRIKGRDANGLEVLYSVEEGVKQFLTARPHLVKATQRIGGGTPPAAPSGVEIQNQDLSREMLQAHQRGDYKRVRELKSKVQANLNSSRV